MKRNKKDQARGWHLNGKTNQYVHRRAMSTDDEIPPTSQKPLGDLENVRRYGEEAEHRVRRK